MKVDNQSAYKLIFSISQHPRLGVLIEPYVIAFTAANTLSLTYQKVFSGNAGYYTKLSSDELHWISLLDPIMAENIIRLFSPEKKIRPKDYFRKHFNRDQFRTEIRPFIEIQLVQLLLKLPAGYDGLYLADDINPAAQKLDIGAEFAKVLFHFRRNENGTRYFATVKYKDDRISFMKSGALMISNQPAFLVAEGRLLHFYDFVEGNKLSIFINRKSISIKPEQEADYYRSFIKKLLERSPVYAEGFEIQNETYQASAELCFNKIDNLTYCLLLRLNYGPYTFKYHPTKFYHVEARYDKNEPVFIRVKRSYQWEETKVQALQEIGFIHQGENRFGMADDTRDALIYFISEKADILKEQGFSLTFDTPEHYALSRPKIHYQVSEKTDWFDVHIAVQSGSFSFPFSALLKNIKQGLSEYILPDGSIFLIPPEWFALGQKLLLFKPGNDAFSIPKFQLDLLRDMPSTAIKKHINQFIEIKEEQVSEKFKGKLRPYQREGLSWLMFLHNNRFGGILADDMGLGKTVQTLAYLQRIILEDAEEKILPVLLVAPTSLIYNWQSEASRFTPNIRLYLHTGMNRHKSAEKLAETDIIITSYGLIRNDFDLFREQSFKTIVLDESQNIKNQSAKATQLINKLESAHRLCLTGTPVENSLKDLWSQMNFLNKGLLGTSKVFEQEYVKPIEKKQDRAKTEELRKKLKPFILRRTKSQVAKELPALTEKTVFCPMSVEQEKYYEEIKSEYRNQLLNIIRQEGIEKSKLSVLQGLTKLRQLANHPGLIMPDYAFDSGKHQILLEHIRTALEEGHKVLVFSQFVSYLELLEKDLKRMKLKWLKLTGSNSALERKKLIDSFQNGQEYPLFLVSLKAGGTGLNLTAADFVFITDPWWNPAAEAQARDRTHRIGQKKKVFSYKFISLNTVEEKILRMQERKMSLAGDIIQVEENIIKTLNSDDIGELFN